jgi:glycerol-3-phosphate dehydrogenase (NAD(P)+)
MGDLIATCTSPQSRNRHVGFELGKGRSLKEIIDEMVMVAETHDVYSVIQGEMTPRQVFRGLLKSTVGAESEPG